MFDTPPPFDKYESPVFVEVLVSDSNKSDYVFGTLVDGSAESESYIVKVDIAILLSEGFDIEQIKEISAAQNESSDTNSILIRSHKEDIRVDEDRTKRI